MEKEWGKSRRESLGGRREPSERVGMRSGGGRNEDNGKTRETYEGMEEGRRGAETEEEEEEEEEEMEDEKEEEEQKEIQ